HLLTDSVPSFSVPQALKGPDAAATNQIAAAGPATTSAIGTSSPQAVQSDFGAADGKRIAIAPLSRVDVSLRQVAPLKSEWHACRPSHSKVFTPVYNTYTDSGDTSGNVTVLGVGSGKGSNIGKGYAAGYQGANGSIQRYSSTGACEFSTTILSGGSPV